MADTAVTGLILADPPGADAPLLCPHPNLLAVSLSDLFLLPLQTFNFMQTNKLTASDFSLSIWFLKEIDCS